MSLAQVQGLQFQKEKRSGIARVLDAETLAVTRSRRASCIGLQPLLTIFDLERLDLQIVAASVRQCILAEPSILRLLGYKV